MLTTKSTVVCWGYNQYGELGTEVPIGGVATVPVLSVSNGEMRAISAGSWNSCILSGAGAVSCWGGNDTLGSAAAQQSSVPVGVTGLEHGVNAISSSGQTCVVTEAGGVMCWGGNWHGEAGNGGTDYAGPAPVQVTGLERGVTTIAAGPGHTCASTASGDANCWGWNRYGELGTAPLSSVPYRSRWRACLEGVLTVSAGDGHTCALMVSGRVMCWGRGTFGELGYGGNSDRDSPVEVDFTSLK